MFLLHLLVSHAALSYSPSGARLALGRVARAAAARMDETAEWQGAEALSTAMKDADTVFDIAKIKSILPHRYPFLLVDKIIEFEAGKRAAGVNNVKWRRPVVPGDTLTMEMELTAFKAKFGLVKMKGVAYVDGQKVVEGDFQFAMVK